MADFPAVPSEIPAWATDGFPTAIDQPFASAGRIATGWEGGDEPNPKTQNGLHFWTEQWRAWLEATASHSEEFSPVVTSLAVPDYTVRRGWYRRHPGSPAKIDFFFELAWTNSNPFVDGTDIAIELPYQPQPAGVGFGVAPFGAHGECDLVTSTWPNKAIDRAILPIVTAGSNSATIQRVSTVNTSPGNVKIGNLAVAIGGQITYLSNGTYLL